MVAGAATSDQSTRRLDLYPVKAKPWSTHDCEGHSGDGLLVVVPNGSIYVRNRVQEDWNAMMRLLKLYSQDAAKASRKGKEAT